MSAIQGGTETAYSAIADYHDRSNLTYDKSSQELEFMSSYSPETTLTWQQYMNWIVYGEKVIPVDSSVRILKNAINQMDAEKGTCSPPITNLYHQNSGYGVQPTYIFETDKESLDTVYDVVKNDLRTSKFTQLIDAIDSPIYSYTKIKSLEFPVTILAPVNKYFDSVLYDALNNGVFSLNALQTVRYHVLPYLVKPEQLAGRKFQLQTDLEKKRIVADFTKGKQTFVNQLGVDPTDPMSDPCESQNFIPRNSWIVHVLGITYCAGGIVYFIDRPLVFPRVL